MSINPDEDTEFNDALRKHGIIPPREPPPATPSPPSSPTLDDLLKDFSPSELQELGEDARDDVEERLISEYRQHVNRTLRQEEKKARFGRVYPIARDDYTREVTEASKVNEIDDDEERGTAVICFLYQDGIPRNQRASEHVRVLAERYPRTKFVSIVGSKCIPNLPDSRTPMFIVYKKGEILTQVIAWGADRERRLEELEALFIASGAITVPDRRPHKQTRHQEDVSDDDDDDDDFTVPSNARSTIKAKSKNIRTSGGQSDSDFEFDL